jgi:mannan endo-1,4-beta-mannosidase
VYFQQWDNGVATINYGSTGLQVLDEVVKLAEQTGLKLILTLTNNWADCGFCFLFLGVLLGKIES